MGVPRRPAVVPSYHIIDPESMVRIDLKLDARSCEFDVDLENPRPGRSFVLLLGRFRGPYAQRVRLSGKARIHFNPDAPGKYSLLLANPESEPVVVRLRIRPLGAVGYPQPARRSSAHPRLASIADGSYVSSSRATKSGRHPRPARDGARERSRDYRS
jgi:hypothetical protein